MQIKLRNEIQEFQKFAQTIMENNPTAYSSLNPGIARYVNAIWKVRAKLNNCLHFFTNLLFLIM